MLGLAPVVSVDSFSDPNDQRIWARIRSILRDLTRVDQIGYPEFSTVIVEGDVEAVRWLVERIGFHPDLRMDQLIVHACKRGHLDMFKYLVEDRQYDFRENKNFLLRLVAISGHLGLTRTLVENYGCDVKPWASTILQSCKHLDCLRYLVEVCGCDPASVNPSGRPALFYQANIARDNFFYLFARSKIDPLELYGGTSLVRIIAKEPRIAIDLIEQFGLDPDAPDKSGSSLCFYATENYISFLLHYLQLKRGKHFSLSTWPSVTTQKSWSRFLDSSHFSLPDKYYFTAIEVSRTLKAVKLFTRNAENGNEFSFMMGSTRSSEAFLSFSLAIDEFLTGIRDIFCEENGSQQEFIIFTNFRSITLQGGSIRTSALNPTVDPNVSWADKDISGFERFFACHSHYQMISDIRWINKGDGFQLTSILFKPQFDLRRSYRDALSSELRSFIQDRHTYSEILDYLPNPAVAMFSPWLL